MGSGGNSDNSIDIDLNVNTELANDNVMVNPDMIIDDNIVIPVQDNLYQAEPNINYWTFKRTGPIPDPVGGKCDPPMVRNFNANMTTINLSKWLRIETTSRNTFVAIAMEHTQDEIVRRIEYNAECLKGICSCSYSIGGSVVQLKPCRFLSTITLSSDLDKKWEYILQGVIFGFKIIDADCKLEYDFDGNLTPRDNLVKMALDKKISKEIKSGQIKIVENKPKCVHGIFAIPKPDGGVRAIVDCSKPENCSVNNYVSTTCSTFSYNSVDTVTELLIVNDYMSTLDISNAYRAVQIHPRDSLRQGLKWKLNDKIVYMQDNRLCMGLSSSPYIFSQISDFVTRCAKKSGVIRVVNYLDDFCIIGSTYDEAVNHRDQVLHVLRQLGFYINYSKTTNPSTFCRFLGIIINSVTMELCLPEDKHVALINILRHFENVNKATRKQLEKLAGHLAHCAKVIRGGRTFSRNVYDLMEKVKRPYLKIRLSKGFKKDINWWITFSATFNGKAKILGNKATVFSNYSDASSFSYAAHCGSDWCIGSFSPTLAKYYETVMSHHYDVNQDTTLKDHINVKEMAAVFAAAIRWSASWKNSHIVFMTDNNTVKSALNTGRSRSPKIMEFVRRLFWLSVEYNFTLESGYVNTKCNNLADALSRLEQPLNTSRLKAELNSGLICCYDSIFCRYATADSYQCRI